MEPLSVSTNRFTLDLYKKLNETSKGQNIFFSPWSIATALSMVYLGAKGDTATQMAEVLHFNQTAREEGSSETRPSSARPKKRKMDPEHEGAENIHSGFKKLLSDINKRRNTFLLKSANRLYEEKTYRLLPEFLQLITSYYNAKPQAVNFKRAAEQVRAQINSWVENQTERKIQSLLPAGSLHSRTVMVLVNAIYFKGTWEKKFLEKNTSEMPFRISKTKTKPVQMMFLKDKFFILHEATMKFRIIELPYVENELSMFVLLPDDISDNTTGLEMVERELTYEKLAEWTKSSNMMKADVDLYLPKLKVEENYDLKSPLSSMGIQNAFDPRQADFTGMSVKKDLFISQVIHKAFVEVNEEGTEAAAATGVLMMRSRVPTMTFKADHPFLFFIRHNKSQTILFFGRFCSPSISSALSMVLLGSKGSTEAQISKVLSLSSTQDAHNGYQSLLSEINDPNTKYILRTANRLYGEKTLEFLPSFIESSQKSYHAGLEQMDFLHAWEDSRRQINGWVEERTEGKIQNLLAEGILNSLTRLVLVNAIYFKGNWEEQFDKQNTSERPFRINKNDTRPVQMMFKEAHFNMTYIGDFQTKILELPYVGNELSMIILLPDSIQDGSTGLERLEKELTYEKLMVWISPKMMESTNVQVSLPRFKLEENYDLKPLLRSMGMLDAFDSGKADFSGISSGNELVLSEVVHKSFVEVNEEGTEAAAATGLMFVECCAMIVPEFTADHPFLFFIRHNKTYSILFCGRFCCP
ncbi:heterochromatin-associated protein MENT-like [Parus major]|uniref:heterochromatin-associated protein MENT-like n=1 Tax=Parus major TaxID=9157 RepID=UPI0014440D4F|nr:heterochromatin-associated protein MENT-like [Parus major]